MAFSRGFYGSPPSLALRAGPYPHTTGGGTWARFARGFFGWRPSLARDIESASKQRVVQLIRACGSIGDERSTRRPIRYFCTIVHD
jgi:hypothetical protein